MSKALETLVFCGSVESSDCFTQGIIRRDEMVFRLARERKIPIFMVLSGGYQPQTAQVIADSILNLKGQGLITREPNL